jgi:hypothetical protein
MSRLLALCAGLLLAGCATRNVPPAQPVQVRPPAPAIVQPVPGPVAPLPRPSAERAPLPSVPQITRRPHGRA